MQLFKLSAQKTFLIITILCGLSVAYAFYAEYYLKLEPCPLCIVERSIIAIITVLALIYAIHNPKNWLVRLYGIVLAGFAIFTIKVASHHLWLMKLPPDQQPLSCGMPLNLLYQKVPLPKFLHIVLQGDAECGKVTWTIFGMLPPVCVIIICSIVTLLSLYIIFHKNLDKNPHI